jgi:argininosuccinate lyase
MKLWDKGYKLDTLVEAFMTGDDPQLDHALIEYDCLGSIAHAKMLAKIGVLTVKESEQLTIALQEIIHLAREDKFIIQFQDEDVHTAIENTLIAKLGDLGKKLHTARSRNDQVLVDLRLYSKDWLIKITHEVLNVCDVLCEFAIKHHDVPMPGRTHFQRAMPSSMGLWAGAFAESFLDNIILLKSAYWLVDQCPLGSAASYGVSLDVDRQYTAELLGFRTVQNNVLYANNSRGKFESIMLSALVQVMNDLSKISTDIIIFCAPEFGYLCLPEKFCPGSSLMPQKRNPCPLELIRAKSATMQSMLFQVLEIIRSLPSGYNRDFQETKRPLMQGCELAFESLKVFANIFYEIQVNEKACMESFTKELFATDKVLSLVKEGIPFRDAYKQVALELEAVTFCDPKADILSKTHQGATGNLGLELSVQKIQEYRQWLTSI